MTPAANSVLGPTLLICLALPAYVVWALPRLAPPLAASLTVVVATACAAGALLAGPIWCLPAAALVVGHLGWVIGRRSGRRRGQRRRSTPDTDADATPPSTLPFVGGRATLGCYLLVREIGRGSMGTVWLAHDPLSDRAVALKTLALRQAFDADTLADAHARFFQEAATARALEHPSIVRIFDAGEADGLAFLAMEYLTGDHLVASTRPGTLLPVTTVLHVVAAVARALAYAHGRGVVHRDVKPANVMFDPVTGRVTLTDFGIASVGDSLRTRTGVLLGTPAYMSPEQLGGRRLDGRSDLYALGVLLFQLLTGELPHRAESMGDLLQQIGQQPAPDVRSRRPELSPELADSVALALQKRPDQRWADGQAMALALESAARGLALEAPPRP